MPERELSPESTQRVVAGFTSKRAKEVGPPIVTLLREYAKRHHVFRTEDIADELGLERQSPERQFLIQFMRRLVRAGTVKELSHKGRHKDWVVADPAGLDIYQPLPEAPLPLGDRIPDRLQIDDDVRAAIARIEERLVDLDRILRTLRAIEDEQERLQRLVRDIRERLDRDREP
jgi:hypothetical protein